MRIIAGEYGGRKLKALDGDNTRPTTDKVKESMFNMIGPYFDGGICLDLFSGSGGLAIEAVSRGVDKAFLIEKNPKAIQVIQHNVEITKAAEKFQILRSTANQFIDSFNESIQFDLVFFDPPYKLQEIEMQIAKLEAKSMLSPQCEIICETDAKVVLGAVAGFVIRKRQVYGTIAVTIYIKK